MIGVSRNGVGVGKKYKSKKYFFSDMKKTFLNQPGPPKLLDPLEVIEDPLYDGMV